MRSMADIARRIPRLPRGRMSSLYLRGKWARAAKARPVKRGRS